MRAVGDLQPSARPLRIGRRRADSASRLRHCLQPVRDQRRPLDVQLARDPGYAHLPDGGTQNLYFGERGSQTFPGFALLDLAATYQIPVFRTASPWIKVEMLNVTNNQKLISWDTTVTPDPEQPARRERPADRLHQGAALRPGDGEHRLPGLASGPDRRPDVPAVRRGSLLNVSLTCSTHGEALGPRRPLITSSAMAPATVPERCNMRPHLRVGASPRRTMRTKLIVAFAAAVLIAATAPVMTVTNGQPDLNRHPYVGLAIQFDAVDPNFITLCSGSALSSTVFLTASHCFDPARPVFVTSQARGHPSA